MTALVSHGRVHRFEAIVLGNTLLRAVTVPSLGWRVLDLEDRLRMRQLPDHGEWWAMPWSVAIDADNVVDSWQIPRASSGRKEFVYVRDLQQAWGRIEDLDCCASLRIDYDSSAFPFMWLYFSYGGWKGQCTAVLEPCSSTPKGLAEAVRAGQSAELLPGEEFVTVVSVALTGVQESFP